MSRHDPTVRLLHMRGFARQAISMASGKRRADLEENEMLCLALTHLIELIGEAASRFPSELQKDYPDIPLQKIVGMRNRLIHGYEYVDYDILWDTISHDLPPLLSSLERILPPED